MITKRIILGYAFSAIVIFSCSTKNTKNQLDDSPKYSPVSITYDYDELIDSLISKMSIEEKTGMLHGTSMFGTSGVERLDIPELRMADGPLGVREEISRNSWAPAGRDDDFATYYPAGGGVAATWNPELAYRFGNSVGEETRARGKDVLLSPAINIIRTPLGGRTYEYFTEDPFLNKKLAVPFIIGLQQNDVAACVKHYAANNQETNRDFVDVQIDERTLREIYLPAFKSAVIEAKAHTFMGAYNKFRGEYLCENNYMLNEVLRDEWGFEGVVISDWAAVHSTVKSLKSGLDIEMGTPKPFDEFFLADPLLDSIRKGKISEREIDIHLKRILQLMFTLKSMGNGDRASGSINTEAHFKDAYDIASESIVLLKNEQDLLPLKTEGISSIAVIGNNALKKNALGGFGAGVKTKREVTPIEGLRNRLPDQITLNYAEGYLERYAPKTESVFGDVTQEQVRTIDTLDPDKLKEALEAVRTSDRTIIFAGSNRDYETEASDRADLELPFGQEELIKKVLEIDPDAIVVLIAGAPFEIAEIANKANSLIWSWFNGSEGGNALADVILGNVNPSGKLPWTMPVKLEDSPAHATNSFPGDKVVSYDEGILVGYRWFDTKRIEPLYPFGFGLSYTSFNLTSAKCDKISYSKSDIIELTVKVINESDIDGKEVVQVYASKDESDVDRELQELIGFKKVFVQAGELEILKIEIPVEELAFYNTDTKSWEVEPGKYQLRIGNSSRNITQVLYIKIE